MSLEKPRSKKSVKSEAIPIELDPKLSSQERLDKLGRHGKDQTHYSLSHVPTLSEYEQGIARGPTIPAELTPEFVDSLTPEEQQHFLENISQAEYKRGSLEKSKQQIALEYYAVNDTEEGVENVKKMSIDILTRLQQKGSIQSISIRKNRITPTGFTQLRKYQAEQELTRLFTLSPGVNGLDMQKSYGYINTTRVLHLLSQQPNITARSIVKSYEIAMTSVNFILKVMTSAENNFVSSMGKGTPDDPRQFMLTERGILFLAKASRILSDIGENLQLKPRANELDQNEEAIEKKNHFRFPYLISNVERILNIFVDYSGNDHLSSTDVSKQSNITSEPAVRSTLSFLYNQRYLDRDIVTNDPNVPYYYSYFITERGYIFLELLKLYDGDHSIKQSIAKLLNEPEISSRLNLMIEVIKQVQNHDGISSDTLKTNIGKSLSGGIIATLLNLGIIISKDDPTFVNISQRNMFVRKHYFINPQAPQELFDLIDKYQNLEAKLVHEHMLTWKKSDGSPVKFY